jgi:serine/threonine protein kinase
LHNSVSKPVDGKYSIQQKLKSGGFGAVYAARDAKESSRVFAVKLMPMSAQKYAEIELHLYEQLQEHKVTSGFVKVLEGIFSFTTMGRSWSTSTSLWSSSALTFRTSKSKAETNA